MYERVLLVLERTTQVYIHKRKAGEEDRGGLGGAPAPRPPEEEAMHGRPSSGGRPIVMKQGSFAGQIAAVLLHVQG
jgi:hypothetical protein